jgi:hypothetical protein
VDKKSIEQMTDAQKKSRARFKAAVSEAAKLRKKNPRLSQAEAVKQAWAILYGKAKASKKISGPAKKNATKKVTRCKPDPRHTDTRSHNVNIRVMSGTRRVGALPVGFTGKFLGWAFKVLNQYTLDGGVTAQIVEIEPPGNMITELNGRTGDDKTAADKIFSTVIKYFEKENKYTSKDYTSTQKIYYKRTLTDKELKEIRSRIGKFTALLNKEVKEYNSGKNKKTTTKKPLVIKYTPAVKKEALIDQIKSLLSDSKKRLKYGYATVPGKVRVKASDTIGAIMKDAASGIKKFTDHLAAIRKEKQVIKARAIPPKASDRRTRSAHLADLTRSENMTIKKLAQLKRAIL